MYSAKILGLSAALACLQAGAATATNLFDQSSTCITANCQSLLLNGTVLIDSIPPPSTHPWIVQAFATAGNCVRFEVSAQEQDLEMTIISPDGQLWQDDDGAGGLRPLIKIQGAPTDGWYTVQISHFAGTPLQSDFALRYGRYNGANPNCNNPTIPLSDQVLSAQGESEKLGDPASGRPFGEGAPSR